MFSLLFITELPSMLGYLALFSLFFFLSGEERGEGYQYPLGFQTGKKKAKVHLQTATRSKSHRSYLCAESMQG
jgi:hypothetical protein